MIKGGQLLVGYGWWTISMITVVVLLAPTQSAQSQNMAPRIEFNPRSYLCYKTSVPLKIDGSLEDVSWEQAPWTDFFADIQGSLKPDPSYKTRVKMLWDEHYFYIAAQMEEPHVWATLTQRDTVIFYDNDFEVFIDPDGDTHHYYELEINALGTEWDLMLTQPYRDGGKAIDAWDIQGLKTGIQVDGTLNDPSDTDSAWTVELAIPWSVLEEAALNGQKPSMGDQWRVNFSRVQWKHTIENGTYKKAVNSETGQPLSENNWVWSPQGVINMHYPEMWGYVQFSGKINESKKEFKWQNDEYIKWYLRRLYYRQHEHQKQNGSFTSRAEMLQAEDVMKELKLRDFFPNLSDPKIYATQKTFEIQLLDIENDRVWHIREDGKVWHGNLE